MRQNTFNLFQEELESHVTGAERARERMMRSEVSNRGLVGDNKDLEVKGKQ